MVSPSGGGVERFQGGDVTLRRDVQVFYFELHARPAHVFVDLGFDGDIDDRARAELVDHRAEVEGDALHARAALLDEELEVVAGLADAAGRAGDGQAAAA